MNIVFIMLQPSHVMRFTFRRRAQTLNFSINDIFYYICPLKAAPVSGLYHKTHRK